MNVERRLFFFRFGDPQARMNWVHVDNLILAHRLAAEALTQQRGYISVSVASLLQTIFQNMKQLQASDLFVLFACLYCFPEGTGLFHQ